MKDWVSGLGTIRGCFEGLGISGSGIDFHWFSLIFIDFLWFSLIFIDFHWFSLIFIDFYRFSLIFIDFHWFSWILVTSEDFGKWGAPDSFRFHYVIHYERLSFGARDDQGVFWGLGDLWIWDRFSSIFIDFHWFS